MRVTVEEPQVSPAVLKALATRKPMSKRLFITIPKVQEHKSSDGSIIIPDTAKGIRREYGLEATVLARANDVDPSITVGSRVVVPEFSGVPLVMDEETPLWIIGEGDIMAVITAP